MQHLNVSKQVKSRLLSLRREMGFQRYNDLLKWLLEEHEIDETKKNMSANTALVEDRVQTPEYENTVTSSKNLQIYKYHCGFCGHVFEVQWDGISAGSMNCPKCHRLNSW